MIAALFRSEQITAIFFLSVIYDNETVTGILFSPSDMA